MIPVNTDIYDVEGAKRAIDQIVQTAFTPTYGGLVNANQDAVTFNTPAALYPGTLAALAASNNCTVSAANKRITILEAGVYRVWLHVTLGTTPRPISFYLYKSNAWLSFGAWTSTDGTGSCETITACSAGDYFDVRTLASESTSVVVNNLSFGIQRIG